MQRDQTALRRAPRRSALAAGRVPGGGSGERYGRRNRPVAPLPRRRRVVVALLARGAIGLADADPRPPRLGSRRSLPRNTGRGDLRAAGRRTGARRTALASGRRL